VHCCDFKQLWTKCGGHGKTEVSRHRRWCDLPWATGGSTDKCCNSSSIVAPLPHDPDGQLLKMGMAGSRCLMQEQDVSGEERSSLLEQALELRLKERNCWLAVRTPEHPDGDRLDAAKSAFSIGTIYLKKHARLPRVSGLSAILRFYDPSQGTAGSQSRCHFQEQRAVVVGGAYAKHFHPEFARQMPAQSRDFSSFHRGMKVLLQPSAEHYSWSPQI
jgi:hypothetical protein